MSLTAPTELAHRTSDGIEVTLLWNKFTNRITLEVPDRRLGKKFDFAVDGHAALDAFNRPYVYAAKRTFTGGPAPALTLTPKP